MVGWCVRKGAEPVSVWCSQGWTGHVKRDWVGGMSWKMGGECAVMGQSCGCGRRVRQEGGGARARVV